MSRPSNSIDPDTILPGGSGINRMIERLATVFPDPDSPTIPKVSPRRRAKLTPSTAFTTPSSVPKYVRRSLTSRRLSLSDITFRSLDLGLWPFQNPDQITKTQDQKPRTYSFRI